jgi:hypothetical protein
MAAFSIMINNSMTRDRATGPSFGVGKIAHNLSSREYEKVVVIG